MEEPQVSLHLIARNARLVNARKNKGWTQQELAMMCGLNTSELSCIETLKEIPAKEVMEELASALDTTVENLFPESLIDAILEGVFSKRLIFLKREQVISLTEAQTLGLPMPTDDNSEIENTVDNKLLASEIDRVLDSLSPREKRVLTLRHGLDGSSCRTNYDVGKEFNVSQERIRQIELRALIKLRHPARSRKIKGYL